MATSAVWLARPGGAEWPETAGYLLAAVWLAPALAAGFASARLARGRAERCGWALLALGFLVAAGSQLAVATEGSGYVPGAGTDALPAAVSALSYPLWLAGALALSGMRRRFVMEPWRLLDVIAVSAMIVVIKWSFLIQPLLDSMEGSVMERLAMGGELAGILILVAGIAAAVASGQWPQLGRGLVAASLVLLLVGNELAIALERAGAAGAGAAWAIAWIAAAALVVTAVVERAGWPSGWKPADDDVPELLQLAVPLVTTSIVIGFGIWYFVEDIFILPQVIAVAVLLMAVQTRLAGRTVETNRRFEEAAWATWHAQQAAREQRALAGAAKAVTSSIETEAVFETVVEELSDLLGASHAALVEVDADSKQGRVCVYAGSSAAAGARDAEVPTDRGILGMVLRHDDTIVLDGETWREILPPEAPSELASEISVAIATPVRWQGCIRGVLMAGRGESDRFEAAEVRVAEAFAEFAGMAIGNAQTLASERGRREVSERRVREQVALIKAAKSINSSLEFEETLRRMTTYAGDLLDADRYAYMAVDEEGRATVVIAAGYEGIGAGRVFAPGIGVAGRVVERDAPLVLEEPEWRRVLEASGTAPSDACGSVAALPVRWQGRIAGVLEVGFGAGSDRVGEDEVRVLEAFAQLIGLARGNFEILAAEQWRRVESERRLREQLALIESAKTITTSLDIDEVVARIAEQMRVLIGADAAGFNLVEPEGTVRIMIPVAGEEQLVGRAIPQGLGLSGRVIERDASVVINDGEWDREGIIGSFQGSLRQMGAVIASPVRLDGRVRAVLIAGHRAPASTIDRDEIRVVEAFAELAAVALGNAATLATSRQATAESQAMREAARELAMQHDSEEIVARLVEQACGLLGADAAIIGRIDDDLCTRYQHATGMSTAAWREMIVPPSRGITADVLGAAAPVVIGGLGEDPEFDPQNYPLLAVERLRWVLGVPMSQGGGRPGALLVGFRRPHEFTPEEVEMVKGLADQGAIAMDTARLLEERERNNAELRVRFRATIDALASTLEARDGYTGDHSASVMLLAERVAVRMAMRDDQINELRAAAKLHDIGKLGIPNEILHKSGPLDEDEWKVMHEHPEIGERILTGVPGLEGVARAVRHEHEHYDGSGYPDGLTGADIPLLSRIVLACDAYHAMTSDRPYRSAMNREGAVLELARCAGSQFDPAVVEVLISELDRDGAIQRRAEARFPQR